MSEPRELAATLVALGLREMEGRLAQMQAQLQILETQLQAAKLRAPAEVERLARDLTPP